jgi:hypothetical protein
MGERARPVPTFDVLYAQIERLPARMTGEILEPGVVHAMSRSGSPHRFSARRVLSSLGSHDLAEGGTGWWFEVEAEIRLSQGAERSQRMPMCPPYRPSTNLHAVDPAPVRSRSRTVFAPPADLRAQLGGA